MQSSRRKAENPPPSYIRDKRARFLQRRREKRNKWGLTWRGKMWYHTSKEIVRKRGTKAWTICKLWNKNWATQSCAKCVNHVFQTTKISRWINLIKKSARLFIFASQKLTEMLTQKCRQTQEFQGVQESAWWPKCRENALCRPWTPKNTSIFITMKKPEALANQGFRGKWG